MDRAGTHDGAPHIDLLRAAQLCHPRWNEAGPLTLHYREGRSPVWADWKQTVWREILRPQIDAALQACAGGDAEGLRRCGELLDHGLTAESAARSRHAGYQLANEYTVPAGERFWKRMRDRFVSGEAAPHLPLVMAVRAQSFHLAPWQVIRSYLLMEGNGSGRLTAAQCGDLVADCEEGAQAAPLLRVA